MSKLFKSKLGILVLVAISIVVVILFPKAENSKAEVPTTPLISVSESNTTVNLSDTGDNSQILTTTFESRDSSDVFDNLYLTATEATSGDIFSFFFNEASSFTPDGYELVGACQHNLVGDDTPLYLKTPSSDYIDFNFFSDRNDVPNSTCFIEREVVAIGEDIYTFTLKFDVDPTIPIFDHVVEYEIIGSDPTRNTTITSSFNINHAPTVTLNTPDSDDEFDVGDQITFQGFSPNDLDSSDDTTSVWQTNCTAGTGTGITASDFDVDQVFFTQNIDVLEGHASANCDYTISICDDFTESACSNVTVTNISFGTMNPPPTVSITSPSDGDVYEIGDTVTFEGSASDPDGGSVTTNWIVESCTNHDGSGIGDTDLNNSIITPQVFPVDDTVANATCTYRLEATDDDDPSATTSTASITVLYALCPPGPAGFVNTCWSYNIDNDDPELEISTITAGTWYNDIPPMLLEGEISDDDIHDVGIPTLQTVLANVTQDNNTSVNCPMSNIDLNGSETYADWDITFTDSCPLHSSTYPDTSEIAEEHPLITVFGSDKVSNSSSIERQICYDTVHPYVSDTFPQDESMLLDLDSDFSITITEPINTEESGPFFCLAHNLDNTNKLQSNVFLYDITNASVSDPLELEFNNILRDDSSPTEVLTSFTVHPVQPLEKLRIYQMRINSYWGHSGPEFVDDDDMLKDVAGNEVHYELTFNTLSRPDILRVEKRVEKNFIESNVPLSDDDAVVEITLLIYPDPTSTLQSDIVPSADDPYYITDLLPPYFGILEYDFETASQHDAEYKIYKRDGSPVSGNADWTHIDLNTDINPNNPPERGKQFIWKFADPSTQTIPWGGRLELKYNTKVEYDIL